MTAAAILVIFPFAMAYAAFSDLISMTIANRVSIVLSLTFIAVSLALGLPFETIAQHLAVGSVCLVLTFACFAAGWMGGGDAKLMAATALWFGPSAALLDYILLSSLLGAGLTIGLILARGGLLHATGVGFIDHLLRKETGIPYGIALGAAGLIVYSQSDWVAIAIRGSL